MQKEQIKIAQSGMKPSVDLSASAAVDNPYHNQDRTDDSWKATLSLEIPVYDRGQTRGEVMKARAVQEQNKYKLLFTDGSTAYVPKSSIKLTTQLTNSKTVYSKATVEAFINSMQARYVGSETEYLFYIAPNTHSMCIYSKAAQETGT